MDHDICKDDSQNERLKLLTVPQSRKRDNPERRRGGDVIIFQPSVPSNETNHHHNHHFDGDVTPATTSAPTTTASTQSFLDLLLNPNFEELSRQFPYFRNVYQKKKKNYIKNTSSSHKYNKHATLFTPEFTMALSRALLHLHFGLSLSFPEQTEPNSIQPDEETNIDTIPSVPQAESSSFGFLCPPIPNRFYYVQWIVHTLLPLRTNPLYFEDNSNAMIPPIESTTRSTNHYLYGLDIGTGATCIYPLLFSYFNQNNPARNMITVMHGTDIDMEAVEVAQTNVRMNHLQSSIYIHLVEKSCRQQHQSPSPQIIDATSSNNSDAMAVDEYIENDSTDHIKLERPQQSQEYQQLQQHRGGGPLVTSLQCIIKKHEQSCHFTLPQPFDFVMTNPPFYDTCDDNEDNNKFDSQWTENIETFTKGSQQRKQNLKRRTTLMTTNEGFYPEGEIGFGIDLILDSWNLFVLQEQQKLRHDIHTYDLKLPHWISMMCGKKSTYTYLHHTLYQLLGPAHICTTQFGPGDHTRWFLAWTYHRPIVRSPLARLSKNCWTFAVSVTLDPPSAPALEFHQSDDTAELHCQEVAERFKQYCRTFPTSDIGNKHDLICEDITIPLSDIQYQRSRRMNDLHAMTKLQIHEIANDTSLVSSWIGDESLPECVQNVLHQTDSSIRKNLLPCSCRHYLLDITLSVKKNNARNHIISQTNSEVQVQIIGFCHSPYGQRTIDKVKSQVQQEICRTSRRWRRIMKQKEEEIVKGTSMDVSMD